MIKFTDKIKQDFLPIEWVKKLQDAGIEMIDSKYFVLVKDNSEYIITKEEITEGSEYYPTYTLSELLYKSVRCTLQCVIHGLEKSYNDTQLCMERI